MKTKDTCRLGLSFIFNLKAREKKYILLTLMLRNAKPMFTLMLKFREGVRKYKRSYQDLQYSKIAASQMKKITYIF